MGVKEDENDAYDAYEEVQHFPYVVTRLPVVRQTFQFFGCSQNCHPCGC